MIYTITFNPAIDYVMQVGNIAYGTTNRSICEEIHFGGKGINVSRVLTELGADNIALGFTAGFTGEALEKAVIDYGIKADFIHLKEGNTRINIKLKGEAETEINAVGPVINSSDVERLFDKLKVVNSSDTLILAGGVPSSLPSDIYQKILAEFQNKGIRFVVDATGELLLKVLKYKPFLIKPNRQELEELFDSVLDSEKKLVAAAMELKRRGSVNVLVSLGGDGALLINENAEVYRQPAFKVKMVNTVGSGDSMIAGFIVGLEKGYEYALKLGAAAGAATAALSGLATKEKISEILQG